MLLLALAIAACTAIHFQGKSGDCDSYDAAKKNTDTFNEMLAKLSPFETLEFPNDTFCFAGGITATGLENVVIRFNGTVRFSDDTSKWPEDGDGKRIPAMYFEKFRNVTFTSDGKGLLDGNGHKWYGLAQYAYFGENRPKLFEIYNSSDILVENLILKNSPYWTFWAHNMTGLEVRYTDIYAAVDDKDSHDLFPLPRKGDITAFNTDGFDVNGRDVWIHDCNIWNQDDCIAVKDEGQHWTTENMLFERINASGLGLAIGSICNAHVRNITFRDIRMHHTVKGIYTKFRTNAAPPLIGLIEDVTYENIYIEEPEQWPIWIGPAQQSDDVEFWRGHPCSLCWPQFEMRKIGFCDCGTVDDQYYRNILLKNITIVRPSYPVGIVLGSENTIENIHFEDVKVVDPKYTDSHLSTWFKEHGGLKQYFACSGIKNNTATCKNCDPVPSCFRDVSDGHGDDDHDGKEDIGSAQRLANQSTYRYEESDGCACSANPDYSFV